jgi:RNA polymerase sigma-70 factor (ECF subfamily)
MNPSHPEARFARVFAHLPDVVAYARRRGSRDADAIGAETMTIAWTRLSRVPQDDPRPWLFATARNLLLHELRGRGREASHPFDPERDGATVPAFEAGALDPEVARALRELPPADRELLLLVAWEELTPARAAEALGISPTACRVRLHRARRRFARALELGRAPATTSLLEAP